MSAGKLAMVCFEARNAAHIAHLKTRSYAQHMALGAFYEGIIPLVDAFCEAYQGALGSIKEFPDAEKYGHNDMVAELGFLRKWLVEYREECCEGQTELENLYDGIIDLVDSTRYKLKFLS